MWFEAPPRDIVLLPTWKRFLQVACCQAEPAERRWGKRLREGIIEKLKDQLPDSDQIGLTALLKSLVGNSATHARLLLQSWTATAASVFATQLQSKYAGPEPLSDKGRPFGPKTGLCHNKFMFRVTSQLIGQ